MTKLSGGGLYGGNRSGMSMSGEAEKRRGGGRTCPAPEKRRVALMAPEHFFFLSIVLCVGVE